MDKEELLGLIGFIGLLFFMVIMVLIPKLPEYIAVYKCLDSENATPELCSEVVKSTLSVKE